MVLILIERLATWQPAYPTFSYSITRPDEMAPNDVDVPRAVSLDYFHESVQKSIINGSDVATLGSTCKSMPSWRGICE